MTRFDILCLCVIISNETCTPLELLWWDNQLTLIGALSVTLLSVTAINKLFSNYINCI